MLERRPVTRPRKGKRSTWRGTSGRALLWCRLVRLDSAPSLGTSEQGPRAAMTLLGPEKASCGHSIAIPLMR